MANEKDVKKETSSGTTPFLIIGGILLITIVGIWWISQSGAKDTGNTTTDGTTATQTDARVPGYASAPQGAVPANFKGSANSPVVIEEFADFQCPTCAVVHPKMNELSAKYGSRVKFIYRNFPLTTIHPNAYGAAVAAEAAGQQGKFWQMQDLLFRNQTQWANSQNAKQQFEDYAKKIGLDVEQFSNDMLGTRTKQRVDFDIQRGRALSLSSTPTVLINGTPVPFQQMEVDQMSTLIDAELAKFDNAQKTESKPKDESSEKKDDAGKVKPEEKKDDAGKVKKEVIPDS
jgi:protein-disulfide isomerase